MQVKDSLNFEVSCDFREAPARPSPGLDSREPTCIVYTRLAAESLSNLTTRSRTTNPCLFEHCLKYGACNYWLKAYRAQKAIAIVLHHILY
jgi:hypothetical protein